eukprot:tig00001406_g8592.t1
MVRQAVGSIAHVLESSFPALYPRPKLEEEEPESKEREPPPPPEPEPVAPPPLPVKPSAAVAKGKTASAAAAEAERIQAEQAAAAAAAAEAERLQKEQQQQQQQEEAKPARLPVYDERIAQIKQALEQRLQGAAAAEAHLVEQFTAAEVAERERLKAMDAEYSSAHRLTGAPGGASLLRLDAGVLEGSGLIDPEALMRENERLVLRKTTLPPSTVISDDKEPGYFKTTKSYLSSIRSKAPPATRTRGGAGSFRLEGALAEDELERTVERHIAGDASGDDEAAPAAAHADSKRTASMTAEQRELERRLLLRLQQRGAYVKNPRYEPDGVQEGTGSLGTSLVGGAAPFQVRPAAVEFTDYLPGRVYEQTVELVNVTRLSRRVRVTQPASPLFSVAIKRLPGAAPGGDGTVAPGMSVLLSVRFRPASLEDADDAFGVASELARLAVPLRGRRPPPRLSAVPDALDCGYAIVGLASEAALELRNAGGPSGFELLVEAEDGAGEFVPATPEAAAPFRVDPPAFRLATGDEAAVAFRYAPRAPGPASRRFRLRYENGTTRDFVVSGSGVAPSVRVLSVAGAAVPAEAAGTLAGPTASSASAPSGPATPSPRPSAPPRPAPRCAALPRPAPPLLRRPGAGAQIVVQNDTPLPLPFAWALGEAASPELALLASTAGRPAPEAPAGSEGLSEVAVEGFTVSPASGELPAEGAAEFTLTFRPAAVRFYAAHGLLRVEPPDTAAAPSRRPSAASGARSPRRGSGRPAAPPRSRPSRRGGVCSPRRPTPPAPPPPPRRRAPGAHAVGPRPGLRRRLRAARRLHPPGASVAVALTLAATRPGPLRGRVHAAIEHGPVLSVPVEGRAAGPELELAEPALDFGVLEVGTEARGALTLRNPSGAPCEWRLIRPGAPPPAGFGATAEGSSALQASLGASLGASRGGGQGTGLGASKGGKSGAATARSTTFGASSRRQLLAECDTREDPDWPFLIAPVGGSLLPGRSATVSVTVQPHRAEPLRAVFEIYVRPAPPPPRPRPRRPCRAGGVRGAGVRDAAAGGAGGGLRGVPVSGRLTVRNLSPFATVFEWVPDPADAPDPDADPGDPDGPPARVSFAPDRGLLPPHGEVEVEYTLFPLRAGRLELLRALAVAGTQAPLGFALAADVAGLAVEYELLGPSRPSPARPRRSPAPWMADEPLPSPASPRHPPAPPGTRARPRRRPGPRPPAAPSRPLPPRRGDPSPAPPAPDAPPPRRPRPFPPRRRRRRPRPPRRRRRSLRDPPRPPRSRQQQRRRRRATRRRPARGSGLRRAGRRGPGGGGLRAEPRARGEQPRLPDPRRRLRRGGVPVLDFGDEMPVFGKRTLRLQIRNTSGIAAGFKLFMERFKSAGDATTTSRLSLLNSRSALLRANPEEDEDEHEGRPRHAAAASAKPPHPPAPHPHGHPGATRPNSAGRASMAASMTSQKTGGSLGRKSAASGATTSQRRRPILSDAHEYTDRFYSQTGRELIQGRNEAAVRREVLRGGRGVAFEVIPAEGRLEPHAAVEVEVTCFADMCGAYADRLRCEVEGLAPAFLPVRVAVRGSPLSVHPHTTGVHLPRGEAAAREPPSLSFGSFPAGSGPVEKTFKVLNEGPFNMALRWLCFEHRAEAPPEIDVFLLDDAPGPEGPFRLHVRPHREVASKEPFAVEPRAALVPARGAATFTVRFESGEGGAHLRHLVGRAELRPASKPRWSSAAGDSHHSLQAEAGEGAAGPEAGPGAGPAGEGGGGGLHGPLPAGTRRRRLVPPPEPPAMPPVLLDLRATTVLAALATGGKDRLAFVWPASSPPPAHAAPTRTLPLTNETAAALSFTLHLPDHFRLAAGPPSAPPRAAGSGASLARASSPGTRGGESPRAFTIGPRETIDLTIAFAPPAGAFGVADAEDALFEGDLLLAFANGARQRLPLAGRLPRPELRAAPDVLRFGPVHVDNARPLEVLLTNPTQVDARWRLVHVDPANPDAARAAHARGGGDARSAAVIFHGYGAAGGGTATRDDPGAFEFSASAGTVPGRGQGQPQTLRLGVRFRGSLDANYRSLFRVAVEGGRGCTLLCKGSGTHHEEAMLTEPLAVALE